MTHPRRGRRRSPSIELPWPDRTSGRGRSLLAVHDVDRFRLTLPVQRETPAPRLRHVVVRRAEFRDATDVDRLRCADETRVDGQFAGRQIVRYPEDLVRGVQRGCLERVAE